MDKNKVRMTFAYSLNNLRLEREMTQAELAEAAGLSTTIISDYENRKKCPSLENAKAIADALSIFLDDFFKESTSTLYVKDLEREPVLALLTVIKLFRFHTQLLDNGDILLSMPNGTLGYSPNDIRKFFEEYEMVQEFSEKNKGNKAGQDMKEQLINHLREKYHYLPDIDSTTIPKYVPPSEKNQTDKKV